MRGGLAKKDSAWKLISVKPTPEKLQCGPGVLTYMLQSNHRDCSNSMYVPLMYSCVLKWP